MVYIIAYTYGSCHSLHLSKCIFCLSFTLTKYNYITTSLFDKNDFVANFIYIDKMIFVANFTLTKMNFYSNVMFAL